LVPRKTRAARNIAWIERYCGAPGGQHVTRPFKFHVLLATIATERRQGLKGGQMAKVKNPRRRNPFLGD
jgi:hypothetical protein